MKNPEVIISELLEKITNLYKDKQELEEENIKLRNLQMGSNTDHEKILNERNQLRKDVAELKITLLEIQHKFTEAEKRLAQTKASNLKLEQAAKNLISENIRLKEEIHGQLPGDD